MFILHTTGCLFAQSGFGNQQNISSSASYAKAVFTGDVNNNGITDVISASYNDDKIAWYENLGGGIFGPQIVVSDTAFGANDVFLIDIDGDGDEDIVSSSSKGYQTGILGKVTWYENDGNGTFFQEHLISDFPQVETIFCVDIDNDGDIDLLAGGGGNIILFFNSGNGVFSSQQTITYSASGVMYVTAEDIDGDNYVDIVYCSNNFNGYGDDKLAWFKNDGFGNFGSQQTISSVLGGPHAMNLTDINGDNFVDIIVPFSHDDLILSYINDGAGNFLNIDTVDDGNTNLPTYVYCEDLDNDGDHDIISASFLDNKIAWYENDGVGNFAFQNIITNSASNATGVYAADIDLDGDLDVVTASKSGVNIAWFSNEITIPNYSINLMIINDITCNNACDGSINISITGGQPPYSYLWNTGDTTEDLSSLCTGLYYVTVTDDSSNVVTDSVYINEPTEIIANINSTDASCSNVCDGSIEVISTGGTSPYTYDWSNGQNSNLLTGLCSGQYELSIIDDNGCQFYDTILLNNNGITYDINDTLIGCDSVLYNGTWLYTSTIIIDTLVSNFGCDSIVTTDINVNSGVSGMVQTSNFLPLENSKVYQIVVDLIDSSLAIIDSTITDSIGSYSFSYVADSYIKAIPNSSLYPNEIPTYYESSAFFQFSNAIVSCDNTLDFNTIAGVNPGGNGFIGGFIGNGAGKNNELGEPLSGLVVFLLNENNEIVAYGETDNDGYFSFENIPCGDYQIWIDDATTNNLLAPTISLNINCVQDSLELKLENNQLKFIDIESTIRTMNSIQYNLIIAPNPTQNLFKIDVVDWNEKYFIEVFNTLGKKVYSESNKMNSTIVSSDKWSDGIYLVLVKDINGLIIGESKLIVSK